MFASKDAYDIEPDIITTAKGLTSGYQPMSATIISDEIYDVISERGDMFLHGMTYSGHPACCAAAIANIEILESERIPETVRTVGKVFESGMKTLEDLEIVGEVRGSHFMMGIEFVSDKKTKETFADEIAIGMRVSLEAQARGLIVRPLGNMIVLSPPLILNEEQIREISDILRMSIIATMKELRQ